MGEEIELKRDVYKIIIKWSNDLTKVAFSRVCRWINDLMYSTLDIYKLPSKNARYMLLVSSMSPFSRSVKFAKWLEYNGCTTRDMVGCMCKAVECGNRKMISWLSDKVNVDVSRVFYKVLSKDKKFLKFLDKASQGIEWQRFSCACATMKQLKYVRKRPILS